MITTSFLEVYSVTSGLVPALHLPARALQWQAGMMLGLVSQVHSHPVEGCRVLDEIL